MGSFKNIYLQNPTCKLKYHTITAMKWSFLSSEHLTHHGWKVSSPWVTTFSKLSPQFCVNQYNFQFCHKIISPDLDLQDGRWSVMMRTDKSAVQVLGKLTFGALLIICMHISLAQIHQGTPLKTTKQYYRFLSMNLWVINSKTSE